MKQIKGIIQASIDVKAEVLQNEALLKTVAECIDLVAAAFKNGNKVLFCGNGGSAADAQHLAAEMLYRLKRCIVIHLILLR